MVNRRLLGRRVRLVRYDEQVYVEVRTWHGWAEVKVFYSGYAGASWDRMPWGSFEDARKFVADQREAEAHDCLEVEYAGVQ